MNSPECKSEKPVLNNPDLFDYSWEQESCQRCRNIFIFNIETGEVCRVSCKSYSCPHCGRKKVQKLYSAINQYVKKWDRIRMWTFTFTDKCFYGLELEDRCKLASAIWKRFLDLTRQNKSLIGSQRNFQYIKVLELQKNGSPHYHLLVDRFVNIHTLIPIWKKAIEEKTGINIYGGSIMMDGKIRKGDAGKYVTKYLVKTLSELPTNTRMRRWSKSNKVSIFWKKNSSGWVCFHLYSSQISISSVIESYMYLENLKKEDKFPLFPDKPPEITSAKKIVYGND